MYDTETDTEDILLHRRLKDIDEAVDALTNDSNYPYAAMESGSISIDQAQEFLKNPGSISTEQLPDLYSAYGHIAEVVSVIIRRNDCPQSLIDEIRQEHKDNDEIINSLPKPDGCRTIFWDNGNPKRREHRLSGRLHNENGPAFELFYENGQSGNKEYCLRDQFMSEFEWCRRTAQKQPADSNP